MQPRFTGRDKAWMDTYVDEARRAQTPPDVITQSVDEIERACLSRRVSPWDFLGDPTRFAKEERRQRERHAPRLPSAVQTPNPHDRLLEWRDVRSGLAAIAPIFGGFAASLPLAATVRAYRLGDGHVSVEGFVIFAPLTLCLGIVLIVLGSGFARSMKGIWCAVIGGVATMLATLFWLVSSGWMLRPIVQVDRNVPAIVGAVLLAACWWRCRLSTHFNRKQEGSEWAGAFLLITIICCLWAFFDPHFEHVPEQY